MGEVERLHHSPLALHVALHLLTPAPGVRVRPIEDLRQEGPAELDVLCPRDRGIDGKEVLGVPRGAFVARDQELPVSTWASRRASQVLVKTASTFSGT